MTESDAQASISYLTFEQVRDAIYATRGEAAQALNEVLAEVEKLKTQVARMERDLKEHRHPAGAYSAKPEF